MFIVSDTKLNEISIAICASILVLVGISILFLIVLWYNDHFRKDFPKNGSTIWDTTLLSIILFMILFVMVLTLLILEVKIKKEKDPNGKKKLQENAKTMRIVSSVYFGGLSIVIFIYFTFADNKKQTDKSLNYIPYVETSNPKDNPKDKPKDKHQDKPQPVASTSDGSSNPNPKDERVMQSIGRSDVVLGTDNQGEGEISLLTTLLELEYPPDHNENPKLVIRSYNPALFKVDFDESKKELKFTRLSELDKTPFLVLSRKFEQLPDNLAQINITDYHTIRMLDKTGNQLRHIKIVNSK